jgi:hypothetical protein
LDRDSSNNVEENLVFLCLEHHDEYDSRTSQKKGLIPSEVQVFRDELYAAVGSTFSVPVHFGKVTLPEADPYSGRYARVGSPTANAELTLTPISDDLEGRPRYAITGEALRGQDREWGPNIGTIAFIGTVADGSIEATLERWGDRPPHTIRLTFQDDGLKFEEENFHGMYGHGVTFQGNYSRE